MLQPASRGRGGDGSVEMFCFHQFYIPGPSSGAKGPPSASVAATSRTEERHDGSLASVKAVKLENNLKVQKK